LRLLLGSKKTKGRKTCAFKWLCIYRSLYHSFFFFSFFFFLFLFFYFIFILAFSPRFLTPRGPNENEKKGKGSGSRLSQFSQQHRQRNKREPRQRRTTIEEGRLPLIIKKEKKKKKKILLYSSDVPNLGPQSITLAEPSPFFSAGKKRKKEKETREKKESNETQSGCQIDGPFRSLFLTAICCTTTTPALVSLLGLTLLRLNDGTQWECI
jgi:hypothetical protein